MGKKVVEQTVPKWKLPCETKLLSNQHLDALVSLELLIFPEPLSRQEFVSLLQNRYLLVGAFSTLHGSALVGYLMYRVLGDKAVITRIGVHPRFRKVGVGTRLVKTLQERIPFWPSHVDGMTTVVPERNVVCQVFLRSLRFFAVDVVHDYAHGVDEFGNKKPERDEDGYVFTLDLS